MSRTLQHVLRGVLAVSAAFALSLAAATADAASTLNVIAPSNTTLSVDIGFLIDDEGNGTNPDTGDPYQPGDINPNTGNPVFLLPFGSSVGQAHPSALPFMLPGGVVPGLSDGSSTTLNGTISVNSAGFAINSANIGLDISGLWQPGTLSPGDANGPPAPAELGIFIDAGGVIPGEIIVATLNSTILSVAAGNMALSGGNQGTFSGPGSLTLVNALLGGFAAGPLASVISTTVTNETTGTSFSGSFTLLGNIGTLVLPFSSVLYTEVDSGIWAQINQSGTIYATGIVPEPSSLVMAMTAMVGMGWYGIRRRNRRAR